jgi:hypothetical protein
MAKCVSCGVQLHPERAEKYNYCTDRECQKRNAKGLTILAMGVNKAQDQYEVLNQRTQERVESGRYVEEVTTGTGQDRDRRAPPPERPRRPAPRRSPRADRSTRPGGSGGVSSTPPSGPKPRQRPWTKAQEDLALIYNSQGMRPDEIARTLGLSTYTVTQMILAGRNRAKP